MTDIPQGLWLPPRTATLVVAASDSSDRGRAQADYVCDGVNDHLEIQAALGALPATGGEVFLLEGTYNIEVSLVLGSYQALRGCGRSTILTTTTAGLDIITATGIDGDERVGILIADLCIDGSAGGVANGDGITWTYVDHSKIAGVWVLNNANEGFEPINCDFNDIIGNTFQGNGWDAIYTVGSNNNTISGNTFQGNPYGIYLEEGNDNTIVGNICIESLGGISLYLSNNNTISGNTCNGNTMHGIDLADSNSNTIVGNTCIENDQQGIYLLNNSDNNTISGNTCNRNDYFGIALANSDNNTVSGNTCNRNSRSGISLASSNNNTVSGNTCNGNSQGTDDLYDNILVTESDYNLTTNNLCRAPTIGTTLTVGEPIGETEIAVTNVAGFEVGMGVVIDLGGPNVEYHRIAAISGGAPGVITIDDVLANAQGVGETIDVPEARYGINILNATTVGNVVKENDLYDSGKTAPFNDTGIGTKLNVYVVPFSDGTDPQDSGYEIDAALEIARAWLRLPDEVIQVVRMKVYARSVVAEVHEMELYMEVYGGADNEAWNTHNGSVPTLDSISVNFAAGDIIFWMNTHAGTLALVGGDSVVVTVHHHIAVGDNCATDAYFRTVEIEYV